MNLKIFTDNVEQQAIDQIMELANTRIFGELPIRIMPDVHAGKGCVIGFTAQIIDKVVPNLVGVDIGCGMSVYPLDEEEIDFKRLTRAIRQNIPSGMDVHRDAICKFPLEKLRCYSSLQNIDRLQCSIGTLGGGNHFIEIDKDEDDGSLYLIIHSGSRNLGVQVAKHYQEIAYKKSAEERKVILDRSVQAIIADCKRRNEFDQIEKRVKNFKDSYPAIPKDLAYLTGQDKDDYLHDMQLCQRYAAKNREEMAMTIISKMGWLNYQPFDTIHNYIDLDGMIRKGAISAQFNEKLLIPINMRDGCILGRGRGNIDWNCSAPHGAGRIMSRGQAKKNLTLDEYKASMKGIHSDCISMDTLDEAPQAYKPMQEIIDAIEDTVQIDAILKPIYNFKAS